MTRIKDLPDTTIYWKGYVWELANPCTYPWDAEDSNMGGWVSPPKIKKIKVVRLRRGC